MEEHRAILEALEAGDGDARGRAMRAHVESAVRHWSPRADGEADQSSASATVRTVCVCSPPSASSIFAFSSPEA